jgi:DNA-binding CsgD family transcriptional regulator
MRRTTRDRGPSILYVAVPPLLVLGALVSADLLRSLFPGAGIFLLLLLPVLIAATLFGARSGLVVLGLGAVGAVALATIRSHPWLVEPTDALRLVPYLLIGSIAVGASALRARPPAGPSADPPSRRARAATRLIEPLTTREVEVLALAAGGLTADQIGGRLGVSRNTVKSHLTHAYAKLGAHNRVEAVAAGLQSGVLLRREITARAGQITAGLVR